MIHSFAFIFSHHCSGGGLNSSSGGELKLYLGCTGSTHGPAIQFLFVKWEQIITARKRRCRRVMFSHVSVRPWNGGARYIKSSNGLVRHPHPQDIRPWCLPPPDIRPGHLPPAHPATAATDIWWSSLETYSNLFTLGPTPHWY